MVQSVREVMAGIVGARLTFLFCPTDYPAEILKSKSALCPRRFVGRMSRQLAAIRWVVDVEHGPLKSVVFLLCL